MADFLQALAQKPFLLADGATGTNLFAMGLQSGDAPELWNLDHPERVLSLNRAFVDAGADLVLTNSFGGNRCRLKLHNAAGRAAAINHAAADIARRAVGEADCVVAGSMGPTGELLAPLGALGVDEAVAAFTEQAEALAAGGADLLWIETLSSIEELSAALTAAAATGLPVACTLSFDTNGSTMMGVTPGGLAEFCRNLRPRPAAFGTNCGVGPAEVVAAILSITADAGGNDKLIAKANCGIPEFRDGAIRYSGTPDIMADYACLARDAGAAIIGGCCGTTPGHIAKMRAVLDSRPAAPRPVLAEVETKLGPVSAGREAQPSTPARRRRRRR